MTAGPAGRATRSGGQLWVSADGVPLELHYTVDPLPRSVRGSAILAAYELRDGTALLLGGHSIYEAEAMGLAAHAASATCAAGVMRRSTRRWRPRGRSTAGGAPAMGSDAGPEEVRARHSVYASARWSNAA